MSKRSVSFFPMFVALPVAALIGVAGCHDAAPKRLAEPLPAVLETRINAAQAAADELRKTLSGRLMDTIKEQGPVAAIEVCATEAGALTTRVAEQHGVRIGRSSTKLRNGANAPRPWVAQHLQSLEGKPAQDAGRAVYDLGEELGVAVPLLTQELCVTCHGPQADLAPPLRAALAARYPDDRATGYAPGQLRGVIWVEIAKSH